MYRSPVIYLLCYRSRILQRTIALNKVFKVAESSLAVKNPRGKLKFLRVSQSIKSIRFLMLAGNLELY